MVIGMSVMVYDVYESVCTERLLGHGEGGKRWSNAVLHPLLLVLPNTIETTRFRSRTLVSIHMYLLRP